MEGYAKVAHLMSAYPEFAIFRRFRALNLQNILYLQAELTHLEADLAKVVRDDFGNSERKHFPHDWWSLAHAAGEAEGGQWSTFLKIREKLENYNDALFKYSALSRVGYPAGEDLDFLRDWMERPTMGAFPLYGIDRLSWAKENESDLLAATYSKKADPFLQWFKYTLIPTWHRKVGEKLKQPIIGSGLYEYNDKLLRMLVRLATTVVASVLPLCSIVVLYFIQSNGRRLAAIVGLSTAFSLALALMTSARKIEVFAATSAFAAINVVYLTNGVPCQAGR